MKRKDHITRYDFVENQDYVSFLVATKKPNGGRPSTEYYITLDMAKQLAMEQNVDYGGFVIMTNPPKLSTQIIVCHSRQPIRLREC